MYQYGPTEDINIPLLSNKTYSRNRVEVMALGKRKRRDEIEDTCDSFIDSSAGETSADLQALFQQHFEATFKPLEGVPLPPQDLQVPDSFDEDTKSEWDGLSDNEASDGPQIIQYHACQRLDSEVYMDELRAFMAWIPCLWRKRMLTQTYQSSKLPSDRPTSTTRRKQNEPLDLEDIASDAANLKKDLALQRLLKESHLLEPQSALSVIGRNRHKAVDMRLQDLGAKTSVYRQQKMPMAHRKGIAAKSIEKEKVRRREAQETGTILERPLKVRTGCETRRQRSICAPAVGKFQRGMLRLSNKDVAQIQGPNKTTKKRR